jgi:hypothetical protein
MQDIDEIKRETAEQSAQEKLALEHPGIVPPRKDRSTLIEAIDQHLQQKIKDVHAREDRRLKAFIKFCLEHKKIINSFIRAN